MEIVAQSKYVRISPRKMRLVADLVRGLSAQEAMDILTHLNKRAAKPLLLTLKQGIGNAVNNFNLKKDNLLIKKLEIGKGPTFKRGRPVSRGVWHPILKRTCHIKMVLEGEKQSRPKRTTMGKKRSAYGTKS